MKFRSMRRSSVRRRPFTFDLDELYTPYDKQLQFRELIDKGCKTVLFLGGRQSGKTFAGSWEFVRQIFVNPTPPYLYWIIAPSYAVARVAKRYFFDNPIVQSCIVHGNRREDVYTLRVPHVVGTPPIITGSHNATVEIRTAQEPNLLRGAVVSCVWIDEAAFISQECYDVIQPCVLASNGLFILTTTPAGRNYLFDVFVKRKNDPAFGFVVAKTRDNPYLSQDAISALAASFSARTAAQELEAEFVCYEGLVYTLLNTTVVDSLSVNPQDCQYYAGVDFGFADPFAVVWIAHDVIHSKYYIIEEYYQMRETLDVHIQRIRNHPLARLTKVWFCDPSRPDSIYAMRKAGLNAVKATERKINDGINIVQMLIDKNQLQVSSRCKETLREFANYAYPQRESRNIGEKPVDMYNHTMDAIRYALVSILNRRHVNVAAAMPNREFLNSYMRSLRDDRLPEWYDPVAN